MSSKTKTQKQSWSIVILCYNEAGTLRKVHGIVQKVLNKISNSKNEVVIVDDGSQDGSSDILKKISKKYKNVRAVYHPVNLGIGRALQSGYKNARYENVCIVPADGQFDPRELITFGRIEKKKFISFYREKQEGYNLFRLFISKVNNWINDNVLGIHLKDVNWVKVFKLDEIRKLDLKLESSLIASEICAKLVLRGNAYIESPSIYHRRESGSAKGGSFKTVWGALKDACKLIVVVVGYKYRYGRSTRKTTIL
jgi:glycosyltransferase involved in cell wall biosynthesis